MLAAVRAFPQRLKKQPLDMDFRRRQEIREWYFGTPGRPFAHTGLAFGVSGKLHEEKTNTDFGIPACVSGRDGTNRAVVHRRELRGRFLLRRLRLWALSVLFIKVGMAIVETGELAFDEKIFHLSLNLERVPVSDDQVAEFPAFKRTDLIG